MADPVLDSRHREVLGAMAKHAVSEIEAEGKLFDPAVHEAMGQIPNGDVPPNTVLQVLMGCRRSVGRRTFLSILPTNFVRLVLY